MKPLIIACFIILLMSEICSAQFQAPDSIQVKKTIAIKAQRDSLLIVTEYFQTENDSLKSGIAIRDNKLKLKQSLIDMQDTIILYKDKQIYKLENTPIVKEVIKTKWYVYAGIIISSICAGIITGLVIK